MGGISRVNRGGWQVKFIRFKLDSIGCGGGGWWVGLVRILGGKDGPSAMIISQ